MRFLILVSVLVLLCVRCVYAAEALDLDTIVVEASRSEQTLADINKPVDVITREDIALSPAKSLPELLGSRAGIYGVEYGGIKNSQVDIGGFGESGITNVLVLVDGRRTNQIDLSGQDWAQIDLNSIERVEIIRGPGTVLYGDNATGGVINIITKKGQPNTKPTLTLSGEYGSYQSSKEGFDLSGGLEKLDYQLNYSHEQTTAYRANNNYWANNFGSHLNFKPTDSFSVDLSQGYHLDRYQLPGALFISNIDQFGRQGVRASLNNDHGWTSDSFFEATPRLKFDIGTSEGEFTLLGSARKRANNFYTGSTVFETMYLTNTYEFQPKIVVATPFNDLLNNKLTGGYDSFYAKSGRRSGSLGPNEDLVYISKATNGIYLLDELTFDEKWLLNAGARGDWTRYVFDQKQAVAGKSKRSATNEGYEGGLGYKYNPRSKVYINYSHSYRLPAVDEFYQNLFDFGGGFSGGGLNTNLTYQVGNEYQLGIKDQSFKDLKAGLNFFFAQFKNEIYLDPSTFANTNYGARTRHYGVTPEASVSLFGDKLEPFANFTWQQSAFERGIYDGKDIPFVPRDMAHAGIIYRPLSALSTTLSMDYTGARFAISDPSNSQDKIKQYTTLDWSINYKFKNMEYWLSLRNLFDARYYAYGVYSSFSNAIGYYPAAGRNVSAGVKVKF